MGTTDKTNATQNDLAQVKEYGELYKLFTGNKGSTTTTTTTKGSTVSAAGIQSYIDDMLSSTSGLASVQAGQKGAGLYSGSTNRLLTNKLTTDVAGKAALLGAGETQVQTTEVPKGSDVNRNLGIAMLLGKQLFSETGGKKSLTKAAWDTAGEYGDKAVTAVSDYFAEPVATGSMSMASDAILGGTDLDVGMSFAPQAASWLGSQAASFTIDELGKAAAEEAAEEAAADAATSEAGGGFLDWLGGFFAEGGRVPKKAWADGGRTAGLRSSTDLLPTIRSLGQYSRAGVGGTLAFAPESSDPSESSTAETAADANAPARGVTAEDLESRTGPGLLGGRATQFVGDLLGIEYETASRGINTVGKGVVSTALSVVAPVAGKTAALVAGPAKSALLNMLFDSPEKAAWEARQQTRDDLAADILEGMYGKGQTALETGTLAGKGRGQEAELALLDQESRLTDVQAYNQAQRDAADDNSQNPDSPWSSDYSPGTPTDDSLSTAPDDDTSGWDGFSSEDAASGWNKGGRVQGDTNRGVDDVPVKLGPKAGGGVGMLDGGEVVLKSASVAKIDKALGPKFLDELNKNPDRFLGFLLSGARS